MTVPAEAGEVIAHYRLESRLGEGGMGVVFRARDTRLERPVALKLLAAHLAADPALRQRFQREARLAAAMNHPAVCQIYDVGEADGRLYLAMELLDGEGLDRRIARGPMPVAEAAQTALGILTALEALHRKQIVHRDLKPSNVFLTPHGVKLLDFGLARPAPPLADSTASTQTGITLPGVILGTCHYMAPEQALGKVVDPRSDIFAAGALLYEMLTGARAFAGDNALAVLHAVVHDAPAALSGSPAVQALDRIIRRALAKRAQDRFPSAEAMSNELRSVLLLEDSGAPVRVRSVSRLLVLPFRMLREDAELGFLSFSLPDAITNSLSKLDSIVVRSTAVALRFAQSPDLKAVAAEAEVDVLLLGSLLRAGEKLQVSTQLVEAASGTVLWSQSSLLELRDVFQLQDALVQRVVESLSVPLTAREHRLLKQDVPASASAYEFYLRANQLSAIRQNLEVARDLYLRCLEHDPGYAPAWAQLGRLYRVLGKYSGKHDENLQLAEQALKKALELNPELPVAHQNYAFLETDLGRARDAMTRLLGLARQHGNHAELYAGLVQSCRYCGLLEASIAAYQQCQRLDPNVRTSVSHTYFMLGDYQRSIDTEGVDLGYIGPLAHAMLGRMEEAGALLTRIRRTPQALANWFVDIVAAHVEGRGDEVLRIVEKFLALGLADPEALFYLARHLAAFNHLDRALELFSRSVGAGYHCYPAFLRDPWLDPLRARPQFVAAVKQAEAGRQQAAEAFSAQDGHLLLGLPLP
jgi:serine/threonine protein kinase